MFSGGLARPRWPVTRRFCDHGIFQQSIEQHSAAARLSTIEAERELIQISVQMGSCDRTLMRSQQPDLDPMEDGKKLGEKRVLDLLPLLVAVKTLNGKKPAELLPMAPSVALFVNEHTFEVDLFKCGHVRSMCKTLVELGESQAARDRADAWRKAPEKLDVPRFLGDIERIGKGRFAQRLASSMTKNNCPTYIKEAIDYVIKLCS